MSLDIKIKTEELESSFVVFDCTGKYSGDNKGGYGIPNYKSEDIDSYFLHVTPPGYEGDPYKIELTDDLPNSEGLGVEILPSQVGQASNSTTSGKWKFKAEVTFNLKQGGQRTLTAYHVTVFTKKVACCVDEAVSKSLDSNDKSVKDAANEMSVLFDGAVFSACKGWYDNADKILRFLSEQCKCVNC